MNWSDMADITDFHLAEDQDPVALVLLPTGQSVSLRWVDEDDNLTTDEARLRELADDALDGLSGEKLESIEEDVVRELTESAFEQSERDVEEEDYRKLAGDMELTGVTVFTDGVVTLEYAAENNYPDLVIYVQLDPDFAVEDLLVE